MKFSANLGFLWTDRSLPDAIRSAKAAGFDAVECHWPYDTPVNDVRLALQETGLELLGLNTSRGNPALGEIGLTALPGRVEDARSAIVEAFSYTQEVNARAVHVMAGKASGQKAHATFIENLRFAVDIAEKIGRMVLIEPLNPKDAPGYFLQTTDQAVEILREVQNPNIKLMFDCYHVGRTEGDVSWRLEKLIDDIGHIQIASVPDRGSPDHGEICYEEVLKTLKDLGWENPIGAEYKPQLETEKSLAWMDKFR